MYSPYPQRATLTRAAMDRCRAGPGTILRGSCVGRGGWRKRAPAGIDVRLTDQTFTCKTHSGAPRLSGAPLAAMHEVLTLSICKRRDAVRLALHKAARPLGAAFGVL